MQKKKEVWRAVKFVLFSASAGIIQIGLFTLLSTIFGNWLVESCHWNEYLVTVLNMLLNFVTEYLFDTFVVFRGSMDTNDIAKKEDAK